jgi:5-methylcytosine-specific restriction endonuclease McrA
MLLWYVTDIHGEHPGNRPIRMPDWCEHGWGEEPCHSRPRTDQAEQQQRTHGQSVAQMKSTHHKPLTTLKPTVGLLNMQSRSQATAQAVTRIRGRRLQERNARVLARQPLCAHCLKQDITRSAVEVDHITPLHLGGPDHESNLQGLCIECHEDKSAGEARGRMGHRT